MLWHAERLGRRRLVALVHIALLVVVSTNTAFAPCSHVNVHADMHVNAHADMHVNAHADASAGTSRSATGRAFSQVAHTMSHDMSAMSQELPQDVSHDAATRPAHHAPSPPATCPLVLGCVGMIRFELDASWRTVEAQRPQPTPSGVTLAFVTTYQDIELPPPRA